MVLARLIHRRAHDIFGKTNLACHLNSKRAAGLTHLEAKEWLYILNIEGHSAICYALVA